MHASLNGLYGGVDQCTGKESGVASTPADRALTLKLQSLQDRTVCATSGALAHSTFYCRDRRMPLTITCLGVLLQSDSA